MSNPVWRIFPYPTLADGQFCDGAIMPTHPDCLACPSRECAQNDRAAIGEPESCRYGLTYSRIDEQRLIVGVVSSGLAPRAKKRFKTERSRHVTHESIRLAVESAHQVGSGMVQNFQRAKAELLEQLKQDPAMHRALADELSKEFRDNLDQSHDFLQLVKLVHGHVQVLLARAFPNLPIDEAAERLPTEGAIYFSTQLMLVKMDSLVYLHEINRALGSEGRFQIHPFVLKYKRIYNWQAEQKELRLELNGQTYAHVRYNSDAIGALIQGLLDNLVKYAPPGSSAAIEFIEFDGLIELRFSSLGPRIEPDELDRIFLPGVRGRAARSFGTTGMGVGLATAKQVSDALNLDLTVEQSEDESQDYRGRYQTNFTLRLESCV